MPNITEKNIAATGKLQILVKDENGNVKQDIKVPNLVVDDGLEWIAARMYDTGIPDEMSHMEVGTDGTAADASDSALGAAVASSRVTLDSTTVSTNTVQYVASFPAGTGTGALEEAGIFNAASGGTMLCRTTFAVINKAAADSMTITWTITIS